MKTRPNLMRLGLRALNRIAGLRALDRPEARARFTRTLTGATRVGFYVAARANRQFKAVRALAAPQRLRQSTPPELFDLTPTEEQAMIRSEMQRFAAEVIRPAAAAADEAGAAPAELLAQAAELGIASMNVAETLEGAAVERSTLSNVLIAEALAHGDMGLALACMAPAGVAAALTAFGSAEQQARYLPAFAGDAPPQASIAVMEAQPLFDPFKLQTHARRSRAGYVLSGEKRLVPCGAKAELVLIAAALENGEPAVFVVESGTAGVEVAPDPGMGLRAAGLTRMRLREVKLPAEARLGNEHFDYGRFIGACRLAWCALAVGTAQAVLDYVIPYANERKAFGEPISHRQAVAFMIANIGIELEGMRLATWRAAALAAAGQPCEREIALARSLCRRHGMSIGSDGVQLLGGHGFVKEHPVERWYRDLRAIAVFEGGVML